MTKKGSKKDYNHTNENGANTETNTQAGDESKKRKRAPPALRIVIKTMKETTTSWRNGQASPSISMSTHPVQRTPLSSLKMTIRWHL